MAESRGNIDIVFRNGFKDYEVLPPPEVWANIQPAINKKPRSYILIRRAAMIALLLSIGFLAYRLSVEMIFSEEENLAVSEMPVINETPVAEKGNVVKIIESPGEIKQEAPSSAPDPSPAKISENINTIPVNNLSPGLNSFVAPNTLSGRSHTPVIVPKPEISLNEKTDKKTIVFEEIPVIIPKRWSIAALASPTYYSQLNTGKDEISRQLSANEQPLMSYSGGIAIAYKISRRISIQSGVYYSSIGQQVEGISSYGGFQPFDNTKGSRNFEVQTSSGKIYTNNGDVFLTDLPAKRISTQFTADVFDPGKADLQYLNNTINQSFSYLELPLILRYKLIDRSLDMNLIGGMSYNFLVSNSAYTEIKGDKYPIGKTDGLSLMTLSSSIGMGMEYNFAKNISLNLEPTFRYYLNPFNDVSNVKIHPYSFGIFSGFSYKF